MFRQHKKNNIMSAHVKISTLALQSICIVKNKNIKIHFEIPSSD